MCAQMMTNLPLQLTSFIGRERDIAELRALLARSRCLTLTGPGGCGKTRLALQVASQLRDELTDGVWLVELASLNDPTLVPQTVATTLGFPEQSGRALTDVLANHLRPKKLLLVLGNCEHLVVACTQLVEALLHQCPHLTILATSRESLNVAGEIVWLVPSLASPKTSVDRENFAAAYSRPRTQDIGQFDAIRLFVERTTAVMPAFKLTEQNALAIAQVCHRLDGIPLAIELAAARVKVLTVEQLAERLDDCFQVLTAGQRMALPHHQTLRATMDWSYALLSDQERLLFQRLSAFAGGCTLAAVEAICAGEGLERGDILDLLAHLVDKSLVTVEALTGEARYRMLETVRQYSLEQLRASGQEGVVRGRHCDWYLALAEVAEGKLQGSEQLAWLHRAGFGAR
jgi:non-specific serine/threonine protein kinase